MTARPVIFNATEACRVAFQECRGIEQLMDHEWAENRLADFNLWASGIGASARHRASLDARLLLNEEVRNTVCNVLMTLHLTLQDCKALASVTQPKEPIEGRGRRQDALLSPELARRFPSPFSDDSDTSSTGSLETSGDEGSSVASLNDAKRDVGLILSRLVKIGVNIRDAGNRSRLQKADSLFAPGKHVELRHHLESILLSQGPHGASFTFNPDSLKSSFLSEVQQRLIDANLLRRNRFIYAQGHSGKLKVQARQVEEKSKTDAVVPAAVPETTLDPKGRKRVATAPMSATTLDPALKIEAIEGVAPSTKTGTTASGITQLDALKITDPSPSIAATTQVSQTVGKLDYPHPPAVKDDDLAFRCPCCCQVLPAMLRDANRWRKHLSQDLCPYTCFLPNCPSPQRLYRTKQLWSSHLMEDHFTKEYWVCYACLHGPIFDAEAALMSHTLTEHRDAISERQIPSLMKASRRCTPAEINACPICNWPRHEDIQVDQQAIVDHIAEHIHDFSLLSLPWAPDEDISNPTRIQRSTALVNAWFSDTTAQDVARTIPEASQSPTGNAHYFHQNDYFAESARSSKSSVEGRRNASLSTTGRELEIMRKEDSLSFSSDYGTPRQESLSSEREPEVDQNLHQQDIPDASRETLMQATCDLIEDSYIESFDGRLFMPEDAVQRLVTPDRVQALLTHCGLGTADRLYQDIIGEPGAKRVFLTLVRAAGIVEIPMFPIYDIDDTRLPMAWNKAGRVAYSIDTGEEKLGWGFYYLHPLQEWQWQFAVPILGGDRLLYEITEERILPFLTMREGEFVYGVFDQTFVASVHKSHLERRFWPPELTLFDTTRATQETKDAQETTNVAVQRLSIGDEEGSRGALARKIPDILDTMRQVRGYRSPHFVKLISILHHTKDDRWKMVLPWPDGGSLGTLWSSTDPRELTPEQLSWFVEQFAGISSALEEIHQTTPNADLHAAAQTALEPKKILLFYYGTPSATLRIADAGLEPFFVPVMNAWSIGRYTPPQARVEDARTERPKGSDIWAFGCILLEHLVWTMSGYGALTVLKSNTEILWDYLRKDPDDKAYAGVRGFADRYLWSLFRKGEAYAGLHGYAARYIDLTLQSLEGQAGTAYKDLLLLVRDHMLVWPVECEMADVCQKLQRIRRNCQEMPAVYITPPVLEFPQAGLAAFNWRKKSLYLSQEKLSQTGT